eukprot:TRINITY_DN54430_c0_g1_i2.p1 TRINITY_DN54430_c0_g1~~TRINITY_DN54430_c0_g1_i2.p1  ORF type:complete len:511 (+),score=110.23 TRINITY_DN54430_c0_g1_i2:145-1677(+)
MCIRDRSLFEVLDTGLDVGVGALSQLGGGLFDLGTRPTQVLAAPVPAGFNELPLHDRARQRFDAHSPIQDSARFAQVVLETLGGSFCQAVLHSERFGAILRQGYRKQNGDAPLSWHAFLASFSRRPISAILSPREQMKIKIMIMSHDIEGLSTERGAVGLISDSLDLAMTMPRMPSILESVIDSSEEPDTTDAGIIADNAVSLYHQLRAPGRSFSVADAMVLVLRLQKHLGLPAPVCSKMHRSRAAALLRRRFQGAAILPDSLIAMLGRPPWCHMFGRSSRFALGLLAMRAPYASSTEEMFLAEQELGRELESKCAELQESARQAHETCGSVLARYESAIRTLQAEAEESQSIAIRATTETDEFDREIHRLKSTSQNDDKERGTFAQELARLEEWKATERELLQQRERLGTRLEDQEAMQHRQLEQEIRQQLELEEAIGSAALHVREEDAAMNAALEEARTELASVLDRTEALRAKTDRLKLQRSQVLSSGVSIRRKHRNAQGIGSLDML